jgi:hypothetical protein
LRIDAVDVLLDGDRAAAQAQLQAAPAHLVEHADLLGQPHGVIEPGHVHHRTEAQLPRALCDRGQVDIR